MLEVLRLGLYLDVLALLFLYYCVAMVMVVQRGGGHLEKKDEAQP